MLIVRKASGERQEFTWELSVLSTHFSYEPKSDLKIKFILKKEIFIIFLKAHFPDL